MDSKVDGVGLTSSCKAIVGTIRRHSAKINDKKLFLRDDLARLIIRYGAVAGSLQGADGAEHCRLLRQRPTDVPVSCWNGVLVPVTF
jgi:hypothetical protein